MESMYFIYDGIQSSQMGLYNVRIEHSGFVEVPYWGGTNIKESKSSKRLIPYFYGVERDCIEFTVQFMLADENLRPIKWTPEQRYKIAKWLVHNEYKEMIFSDNLGVRHYVICTSPANLNLINTEGYIELTFRSNSPYGWTGIYIGEHDISNEVTKIIQLENKSNVLKYYNPLLEIEFIDTNVQLKNLSNAGKIMKFEDMTVGEIVGIDCENKIIKSNLFGSNPFSKFNVGMKRYYMDLVYGVNNIEVTGRCRLKIKSQFPIAQ